MNKNFFTILLAIFVAISLASCDRDNDDNSIDEPQPQLGVMINGVEWARTNVDAPGTFAATPESAGMFFQWNCRQGWPATGSGTPTGWNSTGATGNTWTRENDPCPQGWRVPTDDEFQSLNRSGSVWTTRSGVNGRLFGTAPNQIFLPAVGSRDLDGTLQDAGSWGNYWASTQGSAIFADQLWFTSSLSWNWLHVRGRGNSVRCVAR